jgi:tRNA(Arg) A34 adenosine deaminase TadA
MHVSSYERRPTGGDDPYGFLLVHDDEIIMEARNGIHTDDVAAHLELALERRAAKLDAEMINEKVMYTNTERCPMCSTGMSYVGVEAVVYNVPRASHVTRYSTVSELVSMSSVRYSLTRGNRFITRLHDWGGCIH